MSAPVFLGAPEDLAAAREGAVLTVRGPEARHAVSVRRVRAGEVVDVVDGEGTRARGEVTAAAGEELAVHVTELTHEPAPAVRLVLVQALAKGGRDEQAVETATEVGIDAVLPWQSERCVSVWAGKKAAKGRERWQAVALAATKQSRRARLPEVEELAVGRQLLARVASVVDAGGVVVVLHEAATAPLTTVSLPEQGEVLLVVGPEGGLSEREVTDLAERGAVVVRLGPHVMRTSTAGPVAAALLAERLGRWS
ncbi:16S rRNA (uracil(1498)-N(3))-methyltransferase [Georgenia phoenicis]|uniref:16S rRNA (uracil(1498)-N(3))-methyltransferase n=1 Tax=unclassified Georgenia TaxID=2626815 RepID=UPI0039AFB771